MMWSNVDNCQNKKSEKVESEELTPLNDSCNLDLDLSNHDEQTKNSFVIHADCHASSRGLFGEWNFLFMEN